jgi:hypothetical protein
MSDRSEWYQDQVRQLTIHQAVSNNQSFVVMSVSVSATESHDTLSLVIARDNHGTDCGAGCGKPAAIRKSRRPVPAAEKAYHNVTFAGLSYS